ncbi:DUF736 domain-containing protein [Candidatus Dojkabacteria bacterium]|jgi:hypothetical protein|nr:DUF736 domain-containing protein [Candidatus Dojkabacteria bacterium]
MYERKDGDVVLFANQKEDNLKKPDYKGTALMNGVEMEIAVWERTDKKGKIYYTGKIGEKQERTPF